MIRRRVVAFAAIAILGLCGLAVAGGFGPAQGYLPSLAELGINLQTVTDEGASTTNVLTLPGLIGDGSDSLQGFLWEGEQNSSGVGDPNVLVLAESGKFFHNSTATATTYTTLVTAAKGVYETFVADDSSDVTRVVASSGDTISINGLVSSSAGYVESVSEDASITLLAVDATAWIAQSVTGSWTVDGVPMPIVIGTSRMAGGTTTLGAETAVEVFSLTTSGQMSTSVSITGNIRADNGTEFHSEDYRVSIAITVDDGGVTASTPGVLSVTTESSGTLTNGVWSVDVSDDDSLEVKLASVSSITQTTHEVSWVVTYPDNVSLTVP